MYGSNSANSFILTVKQEGSRIRLGEHFTCFQDFDRCLDSWCFVNGRSAARLKTKKTHCVRVCRFGDTVRPAWRTKVKKKTQDAEFQGERAAALSGDEMDCGDCASADDLDSQQQKDSHGGQTEPSVRAGDVSQQKENCVPQQPWQHQHSEEEERIGTHNHQSFNPLLADLLPTTTGACPTTTPKKSQAKHAGAWLPASFVHSSGTAVAKKGPRKPSRTGACGEQSRLLPPSSEDDEKKQPCPFRVRCQREKRTGKLHITVCELQHTCPQSKHEWRGPSRKSHWLGETLAPRVLCGGKVPVNEMINGLQMDYKISTSYHQMFRARELVKDWHLGKQRKSFQQVPALCERLKKTDPECIVNCSAIVDSKTFKRTFICPSTSRHALKHCQPVVSVYARHTKNKKYPAQLFFATSRDRDSSVVALCFAVAPAENVANWTWFLQMLQASIHGIDSPDVPLIFDRQKGVQLAAVLQVLPGKVHRRFAFPLCANVPMGYGKAAAAFFLNCVYAESNNLFKDLLGKFATSTAKSAAAVQYISEIDPKLYARHAFPLPRLSNGTSSNPAKHSKSRLRLLSLFAHPKLMMEMWYHIQKKMKDRQTEIEASQTPFTEEEAPHDDAVDQQTYGQWQTLDDGHCQAKLQTAEPAEEFRVDLSPRSTCSCLEVQEMLWPCDNVMAWDSGLMEPLPSTPQGLERQSNTTNSRKRKSMDGARTGRTKCSNCNMFGHNIRTCSRITRVVTHAAQQSTEL